MPGDLIALIELFDALLNQFIVSRHRVLNKQLNGALDGCHHYSPGGERERIGELHRNIVFDQDFPLPEKAQFYFQAHIVWSKIRITVRCGFSGWRYNMILFWHKVFLHVSVSIDSSRRFAGRVLGRSG